jgi:transcriptional regulator CtsR
MACLNALNCSKKKRAFTDIRFRAVTRRDNRGGGGYIHIFMFTYRRAEHEYMNIHTPPKCFLSAHFWDILIISSTAHVKISQLVNKMCSQQACKQVVSDNLVAN